MNPTNIYLAKKDLQTNFTEAERRKISQYFDLQARSKDDLAWLLACTIHISEY